MGVNYDFTDHTVVVTGAASGICASVASSYALAGANVIGIDSSSTMAEDELRGDFVKFELVKCDVTDEEEIIQTLSQIRKSHSKIDILLNGVGAYPHSKITELTLKQWNHVLKTNLTGAFLCTRELSKSHDSSYSSCIVNISSITAFYPELGLSHYGAAKAALIAFTRFSALELAPLNIRINSVAPGLIDSPKVRQNDPERITRFIARAPLARLGTYDDITNATMFLTSDKASWITGQTLIIDGGISLTEIY